MIRLSNIVLLGYDCQLQNELERMGVQTTVSVFDTVVTDNLSNVTNLIDSECDRLFCLENLEIIKMSNVHDNMSVRDKATGIVSVHDFPSEQTLDFGLAKFHKRVSEQLKSRFMRTLRDEDDLKLFRMNLARESLDETIRLRDLILQKRNNKPFSLYVFQDADFMEKDWKVPYLHTFRARPWFYDEQTKKWDGYKTMWEILLKPLLSQEIPLI